MTPEHFDDLKTLGHHLNASSRTFVYSLSPGTLANTTAVEAVQSYATMARVTADFWDVYTSPQPDVSEMRVAGFVCR